MERIILPCHVINTHCPLQTRHITIGKPDYLTDSILALMKHRDKAFKNEQNFRATLQDSGVLKRRARVAEELRDVKKYYITKQLNLANGDGR